MRTKFPFSLFENYVVKISYALKLEKFLSFNGVFIEERAIIFISSLFLLYTYKLLKYELGLPILFSQETQVHYKRTHITRSSEMLKSRPKSVLAVKAVVITLYLSTDVDIIESGIPFEGLVYILFVCMYEYQLHNYSLYHCIKFI